MSRRKRLIITADDYGMCHAVNDAVEECLGAGSLSSTCVMVNMPAFSRAASLRKNFPNCSIGIHWTLTQGNPVRPASQVSSLVSPDGKFLSFSQFRRRWLMRQINTNELKTELRAQYDRFSELTGLPEFWNTHQNVHVSPGLFEIFVALGQELSIPAMRCHRRINVLRSGTLTYYYLRHPIYWLKGKIIARWSRTAETMGTQMPDGRIEALGYGNRKAVATEKLVKRIRWDAVKKAVELVIHPATAIHEDLFGSLKKSRRLAYEVFRDPQLVNRLGQVGIEPVGFEALRNGG